MITARDAVFSVQSVPTLYKEDWLPKPETFKKIKERMRKIGRGSQMDA
jgi:hypothetical protein